MAVARDLKNVWDTEGIGLVCAAKRRRCLVQAWLDVFTCELHCLGGLAGEAGQAWLAVAEGWRSRKVTEMLCGAAAGVS